MSPERRRIVVGLLSEQQEFQRMQAENAARAAEGTGFDLQVLYAADSPILQIQQLYKVIHIPPEQRPFAILVETVVGEGLERVARAAVGAGIGWVLLNHTVPYILALRAQHPELPISTVSTDQEEVGRIQARQFRALIPSHRGTVLYIQGPSDTSAAQGRLKGAREGLAGSRIELRVLHGLWTEGGGEQAVTGWLRLKTSETMVPDVIGCQNDAMAVGARRALEKSHRPELLKVPLTGCDGLPDGGQRLVNMKQLVATVVVPSNTGPAIEMLARAQKSGQAVPPQILLKPSSFPPDTDGGRRFGPPGATS
jgi:ABC-type sugar transport system substrate-binding protein